MSRSVESGVFSSWQGPVTGSQAGRRAKASSFSVPNPVKLLFDHFPLVSYPANALPATRCSSRHYRSTSVSRLYGFASASRADAQEPSYNPACLRWQTLLRFAGVAFEVIPSNNHASPAATLPFLLPAPSEPDPDPRPIATTSSLLDYISSSSSSGAIPDLRIAQEPYLSLLQTHIRTAYLHSLYLCPQNRQLLDRLYVHPFSSSSLVRQTLFHQLRNRAQAEVLKTMEEAGMPVNAGAEGIYEAAAEAFKVLSVLLGEAKWFGGVRDEEWEKVGSKTQRPLARANASEPAVLDAHVFSYTYVLICSDEVSWSDTRLTDAVLGHENLVRHAKRIVSIYFNPTLT